LLQAQVEQAPAPVLKEKLKTDLSDSIRTATYVALSDAYLSDNQIDSCLWATQQTKKIAEAGPFPILGAWADQMIATTYYYEGNYDEAVRLESSMINRATALKVPLLKANAQKMIGWMYTELSKEAEALVLFKSSLPVFKNYRFIDIHKNVGIAHYGIATAYYYLQKYDSALLYYDSAISAQPMMCGVLRITRLNRLPVAMAWW
jgi:tetratricopeptide (TPR) repeat protein